MNKSLPLSRQKSAEVLKDFVAHVQSYALPHDQQRGPSQRGGNEQKREEEFGSQLPFEHRRRELSLLSQNSSGDKLIANAMDRKKIDGIGGVLLELLAELQNVRVHGSRGGIAIVAPNFVQELFARKDTL